MSIMDFKLFDITFFINDNIFFFDSHFMIVHQLVSNIINFLFLIFILLFIIILYFIDHHLSIVLVALQIQLHLIEYRVSTFDILNILEIMDPKYSFHIFEENNIHCSDLVAIEELNIVDDFVYLGSQHLFVIAAFQFPFIFTDILQILFRLLPEQVFLFFADIK